MNLQSLIENKDKLQKRIGFMHARRQSYLLDSFNSKEHDKVSEHMLRFWAG